MIDKTKTYITEIVSVKLEKHPNADSLSIVRVYGYQVIVRTDEWAGVERGVYIQPDSVVPDKPEYAFLHPCSDCKGTGWMSEDYALGRCKSHCRFCQGFGNLPLRDTDRRVRVRKFRGEWSQGLLIQVPAPLSHLPIGTDVSAMLGITHYEPPEPGLPGRRGTSGGFGDAEQGPDTPIYDVENWYRYKDVFATGEQVIITEKIHGANFRCLWDEKHNKLFVGSRNQWKREFLSTKPRGILQKIKAWFGYPPPGTRNTSWWWRVMDKYRDPLHGLLSTANYVIYGEVYGNVQDLKYGHVGGALSLVVFDMYDLVTNRWVGPGLVMDLCAKHNLPYAPVLYQGPYDPQTAMAMASGKTTLGGNHHREGCVIRSMDRDYDDRLRGKPQLKIVNNEYLEKAQ